MSWFEPLPRSLKCRIIHDYYIVGEDLQVTATPNESCQCAEDIAHGKLSRVGRFWGPSSRAWVAIKLLYTVVRYGVNLIHSPYYVFLHIFTSILPPFIQLISHFPQPFSCTCLHIFSPIIRSSSFPVLCPIFSLLSLYQVTTLSII